MKFKNFGVIFSKFRASLKNEKVFSARWGHFFDLSDINLMEIGTSYYKGIESSLMGADFKYKWRPNKYRSLTIQGEVVQLYDWECQ